MASSSHQQCLLHLKDKQDISDNLITLSNERIKALNSKIEVFLEHEKEPYTTIARLLAKILKSKDAQIHCHLECFKKFCHPREAAQAVRKRKAQFQEASTSNSDGEEEVVGLVSKRHKRQRQVGTVLPNKCIICGGSDKSKLIGSGTRRRYEELHQTRTHDAGQLIPIAQARGDAMILKHVAGSDAFAREVKYHGSCYKSYIKTPKAGQSKQADTKENRQGLSLFMDHVELRIVTNRGIMRLTELYSIYETIMIDHPNESKLRSDRVKEEMMRKFPSLKFFKSAGESLRQSLLVYNETLSATELLATSLLSVQEEASATITHHINTFVEGQQYSMLIGRRNVGVTGWMMQIRRFLRIILAMIIIS